jgi:hypothetical protein
MCHHVQQQSVYSKYTFYFEKQKIPHPKALFKKIQTVRDAMMMAGWSVRGVAGCRGHDNIDHCLQYQYILFF